MYLASGTSMTSSVATKRATDETPLCHELEGLTAMLPRTVARLCAEFRIAGERHRQSK